MKTGFRRPHWTNLNSCEFKFCCILEDKLCSGNVDGEDSLKENIHDVASRVLLANV